MTPRPAGRPVLPLKASGYGYVTELRNPVLSRRGRGAGDLAAGVQLQFSADVTKNGVSAESGYESPYSLIFWSREG